MTVTVRATRPQDRAAWDQLYKGYATFYGVDQSEEMRDRVWGWIHDDSEEVQGLMAFDAEGRAIGLAHFRQFTRPLAAARGGYLDDLFVTPEARGSGAAQTLIDAIAAHGRAHGWTVIRWITKDDNYRARSVYDRLAARTPWMTYDIAL